MIKNLSYGRVKTQIRDAATGALVSESRWKRNMIFDSGLNRLANGIGFAGVFNYCQIGSSTSPNSVASGGVTFTQSGGNITASASFFTPAMTGAILKYGTGSGGVEQYITYVSPTQATTLSSYPQPTGIVGTVWMVQMTALVSPLYFTNTYVTAGSACGYSISGNTITQQRTFQFPIQSSVYTVNEIGYSDSTGTSLCNGRIVLTTGDTVSTTQYYVVIMQLIYTVTPSGPTAVGNVGSGINTAGNAAFTCWDCQIVKSDGTVGFYQPTQPKNLMDGSQVNSCCWMVSTQPSQPSYPATANYTLAGYTTAALLMTNSAGFAKISNTGNPVGIGTTTKTFSLTTAGATATAIVFGDTTQGVCCSQILTTPYVLPSGTFSGTVTFQITFTRHLSN